MNFWLKFQEWICWRVEMNTMQNIIRQMYESLYPKSHTSFVRRTAVGYLFYVEIPKVYDDVKPIHYGDIIGPETIRLLARRLQREVDIRPLLTSAGRFAGFSIAVVNPS